MEDPPLPLRTRSGSHLHEVDRALPITHPARDEAFRQQARELLVDMVDGTRTLRSNEQGLHTHGTGDAQSGCLTREPMWTKRSDRCTATRVERHVREFELGLPLVHKNIVLGLGPTNPIH